MNVAILGEMIPIISIVLGIGLAMLIFWLDYRKKREIFELHHKERMAAIEKGMEVPPLPPELFARAAGRTRGAGSPLSSALVFLFVGAAITGAWYVQDHESAWWGLVPCAVGLAKLIAYLIERRHPAGDKPPSATRQ